jgi:pilus assembly protein CpaB
MQRQQTGGRLKAVIFLVIALVVAGGTAWMVMGALKQADNEVKKARQVETVPVVVATRDLYVGLPVALEDVKVVEMVPSAVPKDYVFGSIDDVVNQTPRERILPGEPVRMERLARRDAGIGLNALISRGMRAMTIETNAESNLAGFLQPGNFVDIVVTIRPDDRDIQAKWVTETILQGIRVLAVGDSTSEARPTPEGSKAQNKQANKSGRRTKPTVTLEVTPEEVEKLALASSKGDLHIVLRSDIDIQEAVTGTMMTTNELLNLPDKEPAAPVAAVGRAAAPKGPPPPSNLQTAEVIEGSETDQVQFDASGNKVEEDKRRRR